MAAQTPRTLSETFKIFCVFGLLFSGLTTRAQYTDVINSNRPGKANSAYAVGKGVIQAETGLFFEQQDHSLLNTESGIYGLDIALRYGLLFEALELHWEGVYQGQQITYSNLGTVLHSFPGTALPDFADTTIADMPSL